MRLLLARAAGLAALCLAACWLSGAPAGASAPPKAKVSHHRKVCHRRRHHRCPAHKRKPAAKVAPRSGATGTGPVTSWASVPAAVGPGGTEAPTGETAPGSPTSPETPVTSGPTHVQVTAEDTEAFRYVLSRPSVPEGKVTIEFVNHGQDEHNFNAVEQAEGTEVGSIPDTAPGGHPSVTLDMKAGSYTFFCSLPGHEAKGMKATLEVE